MTFLQRFEGHDLLRIHLSPNGRPLRLGILDGSYMGGHWLVTLCLLDVLYSNVNTIKLARAGKADVLFKFTDPEFREGTKDAANLFQHFGGDEQQSGWDAGRQCRWSIRKTIDRFAGYPVQVPVRASQRVCRNDMRMDRVLRMSI